MRVLAAGVVPGQLALGSTAALLVVGLLGVLIADVSGKGMDAALLMARAHSLYHCLAKSLAAPADILPADNLIVDGIPAIPASIVPRDNEAESMYHRCLG